MFQAVELNNFIGTENYYMDKFTGIKYTDGVSFLLHNGAAWLASDCLHFGGMLAKKNDFLAFKFTKPDESAKTGVFTITGDDEKVLKKVDIEFTDFPAKEINLFLTDNVLMLGSEY